MCMVRVLCELFSTLFSADASSRGGRGHRSVKFTCDEGVAAAVIVEYFLGVVSLATVR